MFISPTLILGAILIVLAAAFVMLCPTSRPSPPPQGDVSVSADSGSVITVRKVGGVTSVVVHSHWEGDGGAPLPFLPSEVTRLNEPELYAEYLSEETSATRKYEIIDLIYGLGYTLPAIPGLHEKYLEERRAAAAAAAPAKAPVDMTGRPDAIRRRMHIDRNVSPSDVPDMDAPGDEKTINE